MRSPETLRSWMRHLLPAHTVCARTAAWELTRGLLVHFTTNLSQLARQADRETATRITRQYLARWLQRSHWQPHELYARVPHLLPRAWRRRGSIPLLIDFTYMGQGGSGWAVLQVSLPWEGRALPVYRAVTPRRHPRPGQTELLLRTCDWLAEHLPGPRRRYVLVLDRAFPGTGLLTALQGRGWRWVMRLKEDWKMTHPQFTGILRTLREAAEGKLGATPRLWRQAVLGWRPGGGKSRHACRSNVVAYWGPGHKEPWFLATTESRASRAVAIYRERMRIEAEFRDLKGPWGLDELAEWLDVDRVARFLAWVAVYEWRLAYLWVRHRLAAQVHRWQAQGRLSWIRTAREWIARELRPPKKKALACL
jgi:hypothetical protein